ncbi:NAD-dependent epimerase/dehydratase family protein [Yinghuangia aomiensis]
MYGLDYVALRYFNVYGPRMDIHGLYTEVLIRWMDRIASGEAPLIFGDGLQTMDFVAHRGHRACEPAGRGGAGLGARSTTSPAGWRRR